MSSEDLGVKIGTKAQVELERLLENNEKALIQTELEIEAVKFAIDYLKKKIAEEKEKLK